MSSNLLPFVFLVSCTSSLADKSLDPVLPPCPTSVNFFPQKLPMHCRMTRNANPSNGDISNQANNGLNPEQKQALPYPVPVGFPGIPPIPPQYPPPQPFPIPGAVPPPPMQMAMPMGMAAPMPAPMPMPLAAPSHKLPVIVMPFYSPDPNYRGPSKHKGHGGKMSNKKSKNMWSDNSGNDDDNDDDESRDYPEERRRSLRRSSKRTSRKRHSKRRRKHEGQLLTPVIQYVTKDGYVIYEKEISKNEARTWLDMKKGVEEPPEETKVSLSEIDDLVAADEPPKNVIELNSKPLPKVTRKKVGIKSKHNRNVQQREK